MRITHNSSDDDGSDDGSTASDEEYEFDDDEANKEDTLSKGRQFVDDEAVESENESETDNVIAANKPSNNPTNIHYDCKHI